MNAMPADWGRTASRWGRSRRTAPVVPPPGAPRRAAFCARARMSSRKSQAGGPPCEVADSATRYPVLVGPSLSRRCSRGGSVGKRISLLTCCAVLAQHVSSEMRFPTEPPREQRRDREGPTSTGYRVAESATSQGGPPACDLRLDMRARAQKAARRGAPGGGTTGAVRRLRPQRLAVRPQSAGIAFIGGNRHHLEDVVGHKLVRESGPPGGNRVA